MSAEVGHLAAGVVPEPAEVVERAVRVVLVCRGRAEPGVPIQIGWRILIRWRAKSGRDIADIRNAHRHHAADLSVADQLAGPPVGLAGSLLRPPLDAPLVPGGHVDHPPPLANE